jgi:protein-S-isoprenylcysteine O-methyltransferase Ste14
MTIFPAPHPRALGDEGPVDTGKPGPITTSLVRTPRWQLILRVGANVVGAASAAVFAYSSLHFYLQSHRPIGIVFSVQQTLVAVAYLIRRPARRVTRRLDDWCLAFAGTFIGVLMRPDGEHPAWGIWAGTVLQLVGVAVVLACILTLGRSFGFAAADRGVVTRGAYTVVRHPMYACYLLLESGYLLQSLSVRNAAIVVIGTLCNGGRALAEERLLATNRDYLAYRRRVRRRVVPGVW